MLAPAHSSPLLTQAVYGTLFTIGLLFVFTGMLLMAEIRVDGITTPGIILMLVGCVYWFVMWCRRASIEATAKLIEQSVVVCAQHPQMFVAGLALLVLQLLCFVLICVTYVVVLLSDYYPKDETKCSPILEKKESSSGLYFTILSLYLSWSMQVRPPPSPPQGPCRDESSPRHEAHRPSLPLPFHQFWLCARTFVVSFTTGVWYFQSSGSTSMAEQDGGGSAPAAATRTPVLTGFKLALTKSLGTIAFASLCLAIIEIIKEQERKMRGRKCNLVAQLVACCLRCVLACLESFIKFFTRHSLTLHALTGDDFCASCRAFFSQCTRHGFVMAVSIDWLARFTLGFTSFVLGLLMTAATVGFVNAYPFESQVSDSTTTAHPFVYPRHMGSSA